MKKVVAFLGAVIFTACAVVPAYADMSGDTASMLESMKQQMAKMQETIDKQNLRLQQLESKTVLETAQPNMPVSPAPQMSEADWQKGIKDNIGEAIPWLKGAKFAGDFRLRYEAFDFYEKNNDAGSTGTAGDRTRNRFRIRLRWGFEKDYGDDWKVGFRLATGSPSSTSGIATDNTSPNQTLGNPGYFTFKNVWIDRAYAQYSPNGLKDYGLIKGVSIGAGKFENPFLRYSSTMIWDADVTPEGAYEKVNLQFVSTEETKVNGFINLGQFIVNENTGYGQDAEMYGYQGALNVSTYSFGGGDMPVDITGAVSYYDYPGWAQTVASNTTGVSLLRTNSLLADNFRVIDFYPEVQFYVNRMPVTLWYDYAKNLANEGTENTIASLGNDIHDKDQAWGLGFKIGKAKKKGDWEGFYGYWEIGANSVVAAFNDSDFGGPGGVGATNRKGHKFGLTYKLTDSVDVNWTGYMVSPLNPNPSAILANSTNESVFRSQADVVYKF